MTVPDVDQKPGTPPGAAGRASLAERIRERWKAPVVTEDTRGQDKRSPRSPRTEDLPSPRCVWEDYREGARHYGEEALLIAAAYWAVCALPLAWNMASAASHVASQRPGRFWAFALAIALLAICLLIFS